MPINTNSNTSNLTDDEGDNLDLGEVGRSGIFPYNLGWPTYYQPGYPPQIIEGSMHGYAGEGPSGDFPTDESPDDNPFGRPQT